MPTVSAAPGLIWFTRLPWINIKNLVRVQATASEKKGGKCQFTPSAGWNTRQYSYCIPCVLIYDNCMKKRKENNIFYGKSWTALFMHRQRCAIYVMNTAFPALYKPSRPWQHKHSRVCSLINELYSNHVVSFQLCILINVASFRVKPLLPMQPWHWLKDELGTVCICV